MENSTHSDNKPQAIIGFVFLCILSSCVLWILYILGAKAIDSNSELLFGLLAVCATGLFGILSSLVAKYQERQSIILEQHRQKKIVLYEDIVRFLYRMLHGSKLPAGPPGQVEIFEFFHNTNITLSLWGGDAVIRKFASFVAKSKQMRESSDTNEFLKEFGELLLEMRKEIGHKNSGLNWKSILSLVVSNSS